MLRYWIVLPALALIACDSPQLVSFNTPELCKPHVEGLATFSEAEASCADDCVLCVESEVDGHALTYSLSHADDCVCPVPERVALADAGAASPASSAADLDAGATEVDAASLVASDAATAPSSRQPDAGAAGVLTPGSDGCHSRLHLTLSQARTQCGEWEDCSVCIERVDYDGDARSYMAHQCGCPDAYRVDAD